MKEQLILGPYTYFGGYGANWHSCERNVKEGEVRMIDGILHYAYMINKNTISWARVDGGHGRHPKTKNSYDYILNFIGELVKRIETLEKKRKTK